MEEMRNEFGESHPRRERGRDCKNTAAQGRVTPFVFRLPGSLSPPTDHPMENSIHDRFPARPHVVDRPVLVALALLVLHR